MSSPASDRMRSELFTLINFRIGRSAKLERRRALSYYPHAQAEGYRRSSANASSICGSLAVLHGSFLRSVAPRTRISGAKCPVREVHRRVRFGRRRSTFVSSARNVAVYARLNPVLQDRVCGATSGSIEGAGLAFQATTDRVVERDAAGSPSHDGERHCSPGYVDRPAVGHSQFDDNRHEEKSQCREASSQA